MSNMERTTSWQQIQLGVKDAERLIARKEYNLVMVKARQVLEYMVRCMAERACLVEGDLSDTIDQLYEGRWINKATKDNYHTIRILGNKAVHEGDSAAHDANQAYQLLTQEVYVFANELSGGRATGRTPQTGRIPSSRQPAQRQGPSGPRHGSGQQRPQGGRRPGYSGSPRQGGQRKRKRRRVSPMFYVWRLLIPLLIVVLLIVVIRTMIPSGEKDKDPTTTAPTVSTAATEPPPTMPPEPETTVAETEPPAAIYRIKGSSVNVRKEPSTDSRILVQLANGTQVDYVKRYSNDWDVINYDGQEAYISSRFLEKVEPAAETEVPSESGNAQ